MNLTIDTLFLMAVQNCKHVNIVLMRENCELCQLLEPDGVKHPSSLNDLDPADSVSMVFLIQHAQWSATFYVDFTINSEMKIPYYYLSLESVENMGTFDKIFIQEKGEVAWNIIKELIENDP